MDSAPSGPTRPHDPPPAALGGRPNGPPHGPQVPEFTDEELDAYILTRLKALGVDLSVLPTADESAPTDQNRILQSARRFLRTTPHVIHGFVMDPQVVVPGMYPVGLRGSGDGAAPGGGE